MTMRLRMFSKRPPFPGEMRFHVGGNVIPVMFARDKTNVSLYSKKNIPFENVVPQVWDYATSDPHKERDYPFRGFFLGAGESIQLSPQPSLRYSECLNVDPSLGFAVKAPHFHDDTPASTGWVADFVEGVHNGALTLFALCGRYTNRLQNDDTWTVSDDLGAGKLGTQAVRYEGTGGGPVDGVYVANTGSKVRQYDGALWHDCAVQGTAITKRREELWIGLGNTVRKVTADPTNIADYAAAIPIGDLSSSINWLSSIGTQLAIFKAESLYGLDVDLTTDTVTIIPIAENMVQRSAYNGVNAASWLGSELFAPIGGSLFRIDVQIAYSVPVQLDLNPVPLAFHQSLAGLNTGIPVATAGHNDWTLYVGQYNSATGHSYIGKYGSWVPPTLTGAPDYSFVKAFHPGVKEIKNKRLTCMKIWGRAGENQRLWLGFSDGTVQYAWLPNQSPDTAAESVTNGGKCEFTLDAGYIRWPLFTAGFEAVTKLFRGFSAFGPQLSDTNKVKQSYRTDNTGSYVDLADEFTTAGQRVDIGSTTIGTSLDCKTSLDNADINSTPIVEGMALHHQLRPKETFEHEGMVDLGAAVPLRNGAVPILNAEKLRSQINEAMQSFGSVSCDMPDGTTQDLIIYDHGENAMSARVSVGSEWTLPFKAVQFTSSIALGTYKRVMAWTYAQLKQIRYGGLPKI